MSLLTTVEKNTAFDLKLLALGLPRWLGGKESTCQYRRHKRYRLNPWVRKIPWRRKW